MKKKESAGIHSCMNDGKLRKMERKYVLKIKWQKRENSMAFGVEKVCVCTNVRPHNSHQNDFHAFELDEQKCPHFEIIFFFLSFSVKHYSGSATFIIRSGQIGIGPVVQNEYAKRKFI